MSESPPANSSKTNTAKDLNQSAETYRAHGPWRIVDSQVRYQDPWVRVVRDEVIRPDGLPGSYCVITLKPGVCVVALDDQDRVHLTREFHYAVGEETVEGVSGGRDGAEPPLLAAQRELREELGLLAAKWIDLGQVDPFTANVFSPTQLYLAMELTRCERELEGTEQIQPVVIGFDQAIEMVMDSRITHAPSCVALLKAARHLKRFP
ncbi:MAG: NUDIX hydrolase [Pirellulaceae bacterium]|nr:NUDIX hydrolase [Pirellulaceae bacterium]